MPRRLVALALLAALASPAFAQDATIYSPMDRVHPVWARHGMVASQEALATQIGVDVLKQGGNAVDAAVTAALVAAAGLSLTATDAATRPATTPAGEA